jgi:hypothetical protein
MRTSRAFAVVAVIVVLLAAGCSAAPPEPKKPANRQMSSAVEKVNGISVSLRSEPAVTAPGGTFALTLVVRNLSGKAVTYDLKSGQTYDFLTFRKGGEEIWRWSRGVLFTQALNPVTIEPGGSEVYKVAWNTGSTGTGLYTIQGFFMGLPDVRPAVSVEITGG